MGDMKNIDLRDWFAGHALGGILSNSQFPLESSGEPFDQYATRVVDSAYRIAEAMLKQGRILRKEPFAKM
jgi:hypothetical protein